MISLRTWNEALRGVLPDGAFADRKNRVHHRHVNKLSLAGPTRIVYRGEDAKRQHQSGDRVTYARSDFGRHSTRLRAGDGHHSSHGLSDHVVRWPIYIGRIAGSTITKSSQTAVNEPRIYFRQNFVAQTEPIHYTSSKVLNDGVGVLTESLEDIAAFFGLQVQTNGSFIAVDALKIGTKGLGVIRMSTASGNVSAWRLNLDDFGTLVGQNHGCVRACQHLREIQNTDVGKSTERLWQVASPSSGSFEAVI
jgi:hypothetical protein